MQNECTPNGMSQSADWLGRYDWTVRNITPADSKMFQAAPKDYQRVYIRFATFDNVNAYAIFCTTPAIAVPPTTAQNKGERCIGTLPPIEYDVATSGPMAASEWFALTANPLPVSQRDLIVTEVFYRRPPKCKTSRQDNTVSLLLRQILSLLDRRLTGGE